MRFEGFVLHVTSAPEDVKFDFRIKVVLDCLRKE